jgi:hypothetical protein
MSDLAPDDLLQHTALSEPENSEPSRGMWSGFREVLGHGQPGRTVKCARKARCGQSELVEGFDGCYGSISEAAEEK